MRINEIKNCNNKRQNLSFKGVESAYAYRLPQENPLEYQAGIAVRLNDEGTKDLTNYKNLLKKYKKLNETMAGKAGKSDFMNFEKVTDNVMVLETSRKMKYGPRFDRLVDGGSINNKPLNNYMFTVGDGKRMTPFNNPKYEKLQRDFYIEFKEFVQTIVDKVLTKGNIARNNGIQDVQRAMRNDVKDYCAPKLLTSEFENLVKLISKSLSDRADCVLQVGKFAKILK